MFLYFILITGMLLIGGVLAAFGLQQAIIDTGVLSLLWVVYTTAIVWLVCCGVYCFIQLLRRF